MRLIPWVPFEPTRPMAREVRPHVLDMRAVSTPAELDRFVDCSVALSAECIPLLPPDPFSPAWGILSRNRFKSIAIDGMRIAQQARRCAQVAGLRHPYARVVVRLRDDGDQEEAGEIADYFGSALRAIWYGVSDLIVDYRGLRAPADLRSPPFQRVPSSDWTRSKLLVVARALGVELWGQTNLTLVERADRAEWAETCRFAAAEGFDALVER